MVRFAINGKMAPYIIVHRSTIMRPKFAISLSTIAAVVLALSSAAQTVLTPPTPKKAKRAAGEQPPSNEKFEMEQNLSLDLEKSGHKLDYKLSWDGKDADIIDPRGHLHLRRSGQSAADTGDDFDLGVFPRAIATYYELPGRNIVVIQQTGLGAPAGDQFHVFSSANGILYRVQFLDGGKSEPIIFGEHYSAGSPAAISFLKGGAIIKTLNAWPLEDNAIHFKEYEWDGANYKLKKASICAYNHCPDIRHE